MWVRRRSARGSRVRGVGALRFGALRLWVRRRSARIYRVLGVGALRVGRPLRRGVRRVGRPRPLALYAPRMGLGAPRFEDVRGRPLRAWWVLRPVEGPEIPRLPGYPDLLPSRTHPKRPPHHLQDPRRRIRRRASRLSRPWPAVCLSAGSCTRAAMPCALHHMRDHAPTAICCSPTPAAPSRGPSA